MIAKDLRSGVERLGEMIAEASIIVPFTGAGISTECGIPDFRSPGGIWTRNRPIPFDEFVVSFEVGARKPAEAFFKEVLTAAAAPAHECMYIDDRPEYVHAARSMGMSGAVYGPGVKLAKALQDVGIRL